MSVLGPLRLRLRVGQISTEYRCGQHQSRCSRDLLFGEHPGLVRPEQGHEDLAEVFAKASGIKEPPYAVYELSSRMLFQATRTRGAV